MTMPKPVDWKGRLPEHVEQFVMGIGEEFDALDDLVIALGDRYARGELADGPEASALVGEMLDRNLEIRQRMKVLLFRVRGV